MRSIGATLIGAVVVAGAAVMANATPAEACRGCKTGDGTGYEHLVDKDAGTVTRLPKTSEDDGSTGEPKWAYDWRDKSCMSGEVGRTCELVCDNGQEGIPLNVYRRAFGTSAPFEYWKEVCVDPQDGVSRDEIEQGVYEYVRENVELPKANIQPPGGEVLVNMPVIAWSAKQQPLDFDFEQPVSGSVHAEPTWKWDFDDGAPVDGHGREYDGTDPKTNPDYYVQHTYDKTSKRTVTVTNTWDATLTIQGLDGPVQFELDPLELTDTADLAVLESRAVLGGS